MSLLARILAITQNYVTLKSHKVGAVLACEQALRSALAARREKEGELATTSLEFEYLHRKRRLADMTLVMTSLPWALVVKRLFSFSLVSASR